jgi:hypothetical protein
MLKSIVIKYKLLHLAVPLFSFILLLFAFSSCGIYSFSEKGTVVDSAKTVRITPFENKAAYVNPQITPALTERFRTKVQNQTRLTNTNNDNADYQITGYIADYAVSTTGVTTNNGQQQTSVNRLTVRVHISLSRFGNTPEEFDVSRSFDFSAQQSLQAAEASLLEEMIRNLSDEIFNRLFSNW